MAASTDGAMKAEDDEGLFTPPELSKTPSDQSFASSRSLSPTVNETICKKETMVCNAQSAAGSSPRLVQEAQLMDHELMHCSDAASNAGIPAELESNLTLEATGMSLPPMVDSVTNDMLRVSINHALGNTEEHMHLANDHTEVHKMSMLFFANVNDGVEGDASGKEAGAEPKSLSSNGHGAIDVPSLQMSMSVHVNVSDGVEGDASGKEVGVEPKPLSGNGHAVIVKADVPSLQMNNCMVGINNGMQGSSSMDASELGSNNDAYCGDDDSDDDDEDNNDDDDDEEANDDDDDEVDDSILEDQDSDSSSSTSSLSFLGSSSDDDNDEVDSLHRILNNANNQKDLVMEEESECEEGELKESPSQRRKKGGLKKKTVNEHSEDEDGLKEPVRSKKKEEDLPYVPKVSVTLKEYHKTVPVGFVSSVVGVNLIVEGLDGQQALTEGSILWLTDTRLPLGVIDELFGPVKKPFYVVRYNDPTEMPEGAKEGAHVSYVQDFADFVLKNPDLYSKGYDESGNEEDSNSEVNFSDDEKEAEYKRLKSRMKRGNSESRTLEVDNRQQQERRAEGKRMNRENKNWRSKGESAKGFQSNQEFGGRPPRHQNVRFQHHRSEREPPYADVVEPMQTSNEQYRNWRGNRLPVCQANSQQSVSVGQSKPLAPVKTSDGSIPSPSEVQPSNFNPLQSVPAPSQVQMSNPIPLQSTSSPTITAIQSCTSQQIQMNQFIHGTPQQAQLQSFPQPSSQQVQLLHMNQPRNLMQFPPQQRNMNESHGLNHPTLPQAVPWQARQPQMPPSQSPSIQHSQMPVYSDAVVAGHVPQVAIGGCGISLPNKPPLQPGADMVQGLPSAYQSPIYQQQAPTLNHFSCSMPYPFSGQGSQAPPNVGMPIGTHIPANGFPVGVQPTALAAPVLGIPAVQANIPFNYSSMQTVGNQNLSGFTPAFANPNLPATYGVSEPARPMQPMAAASWQYPLQDSSALPPQQPFYQRPHQMRGPHQGRRF